MHIKLQLKSKHQKDVKIGAKGEHEKHWQAWERGE